MTYNITSTGSLMPMTITNRKKYKFDNYDRRLTLLWEQYMYLVAFMTLDFPLMVLVMIMNSLSTRSILIHLKSTGILLAMVISCNLLRTVVMRIIDIG